MPGIGTIVNVIAIVAGTLIGVMAKGGIAEKYQKAIFTGVGLSVLFIGLLGVINNQGDTMMLIFSLILGGVLGELIDLEAKTEMLGEKIKKRFVKEGSAQSATFVEGFVTASILFVVGAMAIVGSLNDGLLHDPSVLYTKSILDGITAIVLGASLGIGVAFSAIPILIYEGAITLLAGILSPVLSETLIKNMSFVGNVIIFCIGLNFLFPKTVKTGNLFPAMFMPIILQFFFK